jgi:hypothetical protein
VVDAVAEGLDDVVAEEDRVSTGQIQGHEYLLNSL